MTTEYIIYIEVHTKSATYSSFSPCFSVGEQYFLELIHPWFLRAEFVEVSKGLDRVAFPQLSDIVSVLSTRKII